MQKVTIYTKPNCPSCDKAKALLKLNGLTYQEIEFDIGQERLESKAYVNVSEFKTQYPTAKAAPQILIDDIHIGGFLELQRALLKVNTTHSVHNAQH
jgi:glutaredoxin 3